ncbi:hypothetical protein POM88_006356 [Heracleum sosnowskyi]|uniref:Uncharacterized protein n=1 Tax=Heracleum sosnowskyi TaxID=360622 RepID=A0AAD8J4Q1_9APIA|nr:hypothetical protein POM88_006356 [Heracleum sosnowskyi]
MELKIDSLSTMVASGFSTIQEVIQALSANLGAANFPKGETKVRSESQKAKSGTKGIPKQDVAQGEPGSKKASRSEGEPGTKGRSVPAKRKRGTQGDSGSKGEKRQEAEILFEYEIAGEKVLMSKETLESMQKGVSSKHPILPSVTIREPTPTPKESALERQWREKEEQNKLGKGKDKMPEYILSGNTWGEGTEFSQEDANALMVDYRESTLKNHDEDFYKVVDEAMKEPSRRLSNCSTLLKERITSVCVKINEERRWAIDVYLNTGISMFITMQLLQSLPARVLTVMKNKITANHTAFNEILHLQMLSLISEKLPEVYTNPFCVYYAGTTKSGSKRCAYMSLGGTSTMESKSILKVLNMILNSKANKERVLAGKKGQGTEIYYEEDDLQSNLQQS